MTTAETTVRPRRPPRSSLLWILPALLVVAAALVVVNLSQSTPNRETITVLNRTPTHVTLSVTGAARDGWLGLGTVDPRSRATFESVADQGRIWRFRLTVGPTGIGEIVRTAEQLRAADWTLSIPATTTEGLPPDRR